MRTIGAIMEINPFHNGHKYFLSQIKKEENDVLIVVISTSVTQRGEISVLNKEVKTKLLLDHNVDVVLELPSVLANQGGLYFARHAIDTLKTFDITDLYFGSESNNLDHLQSFVNQDITQRDFKNGIYKEELDTLKSNDILGISYLKNIKDTMIKPNLVKRIYNDYNDTEVVGQIASATSIRTNIDDYELIKDTLPKQALDNVLTVDEETLFTIFINNLDVALNNGIKIFLSEDNQLLNKLDRIIKQNDINSLDELTKLACDKNNSQNKIRRVIINTVLLVKQDDYQVSYTRVLGFSKLGQSFLKEYKGQYITSLKNSDDKNAIIELRMSKLVNNLTQENNNDFNKVIIKE